MRAALGKVAILFFYLLLRIEPHSIAGKPTPVGRGHGRLQQDESYANMISVQCSQTSLFLCQDDKVLCMDNVQNEQDEVIQEIHSRHPGAAVVARTYKLVNAIFMKLPSNSTGSNLGDITGVKYVSTHRLYDLDVQDVVDSQEIPEVRETYCATGKGVKVAVLDTGIDYTHEALDGPGTVRAHRRAFGINKTSTENTRRDGLFPTKRVVDGYDFVGDQFSGSLPVRPDHDPIDAAHPRGHGTSVASVITAVAPDVELIAIKVCTIDGCPEFAVLQGLEYALDPNGDNSTDDKVDIINMSLTSKRFSALYCIVSCAIEEAIQLGVLTIVAFGNQGNAPYSAGSTGTTPHAIGVAATGPPGAIGEGIIEAYSARGPGANNTLKPDLAAPSRFLTAKSGSGTEYVIMSGTSFSAPIVTGCAALLKEKCSTCSPFATKAILMNTAHHNIKAAPDSSNIAPVTRMGSGEVRIRKALEADFWAYSPDGGDVQPSLTLGLVNAAHDVVIRRRIKVISLTTESQTLSVRSVVRYSTEEARGAVTIVFVPDELVLSGCSGEAMFHVEFHIVAAKVPNNFMNSGGALGTDPETLDKNEIDGQLLISSKESGKEIGIAFHMIIRRAADISVLNPILPASSESNVTVVRVKNRGAGVAQIDAYELLALGEDEPEVPRSGENRQVSIRDVGYRTLDVGRPDCSFLLEFAFTLWERPETLDSTFVYANIRVESDRYMLTHNGLSSRNVDCRVINIDTEEESCTGFQVDHGTTTGNIILRACAEDFGITEPRSIQVQFHSSATPVQDGNFSDSTPLVTISVPGQMVSATSFNVGPGENQSFSVLETDNANSSSRRKLGLQLITNAYRSTSNTGAATIATETVLLLKENVTTPPNQTADVQGFPDAAHVRGPACLWREEACAVTESPTVTPFPTFSPSVTPVPTSEPTPRPQIAKTTGAPTCLPEIVPRASVPTVSTSTQHFLPFSLGCAAPVIIALALLLA